MLIRRLRAAAREHPELAGSPGFGIHIAHLANAEALPSIAAAKADGEACRNKQSLHDVAAVRPDELSTGCTRRRRMLLSQSGAGLPG